MGRPGRRPAAPQGRRADRLRTQSLRKAARRARKGRAASNRALDSFDKDGSTIHFQRFDLQVKAHLIDLATVATVADDRPSEPAARQGPQKPRPPAPPPIREPRRRPPKPPAPRSEPAPPKNEDAPPLVAALKEWRLAEARRRRTPAFHILYRPHPRSDRRRPAARRRRAARGPRNRPRNRRQIRRRHPQGSRRKRLSFAGGLAERHARLGPLS